jgi:hypothetical protein
VVLGEEKTQDRRPATAQDGTGEGASESRRGAHLPELASKGGQAVVSKYGSEHMASIGRKGSRAVIKKYGLRFYSEIAARNKGVRKQRRADQSAA